MLKFFFENWLTDVRTLLGTIGWLHTNPEVIWSKLYFDIRLQRLVKAEWSLGTSKQLFATGNYFNGSCVWWCSNRTWCVQYHNIANDKDKFLQATFAVSFLAWYWAILASNSERKCLTKPCTKTQPVNPQDSNRNPALLCIAKLLYTCTGQAAASPKAQMVCPSICLLSSCI